MYSEPEMQINLTSLVRSSTHSTRASQSFQKNEEKELMSPTFRGESVESCELLAWLRNYELDQLYDRLVTGGFDDLGCLME
jgi:hypothetical protein